MRRMRTAAMLVATIIANAPVIGFAQESASTATPLERIRVSDDGTHFVGAKSGKRFIVWGVNYDHDNDSNLLEDYWAEQWPAIESDFAEMKALGVNVARVHLQVEKFMESPTQANAANLKRLTDLVHLAERTGIYLDLTGLACYLEKRVPDWYTKMDAVDRWEVQARFWEAVADACEGSPAIFCYDLMNEPVLPGEGEVKDDWLPGEFAGMNFVQYLTLDLKGKTRKEVAAAWVKQMCDAIRRVDEKSMITVGVIPWALTFKGAPPIFYDKAVMGPLDFAAVHFYPKTDEIDAAIDALRVYEVGKPLIVEEMFPLSCGGDQLEEFIWRSAPFCDGWISFYWGQTIEEARAQGDMKGAVMAAWLEQFKRLGEEMKAGIHHGAAEDTEQEQEPEN